MTTTKNGLAIEDVTISKAAQTPIVEDVLEGTGVVEKIPKSPRTLRPKKYKQAMAPIRKSLGNPLCSKLSMAGKGKDVMIDTDEEERGLQDLTIVEKEDEGMEEDIPPTHSATKLPTYVPPLRGKTKVLKDLDKTKSSLHTLLLPNGIVFEDKHLGHMPTMKFEYQDLANCEKFPHLETKNLVKQNIERVVTTLELWKWLCGVEKAGSFHLLWVLHVHCTPITIFIIKQLLCLMHDGYL